jgi:transcriptional regulator with XRE-family HTH domain
MPRARKSPCNYMPRQKITQDASQTRLGELLRKAREAAGLTQATAAAQLMMDPGHLSRIERGRGTSRKTLVALAALYKQPLSYFGIEPEGLGTVPRDTSPARPPAARQDATESDSAGPRHLRNLPLEVRVYLDELRLKLTKGGATEEEVDRAMALLRRPAIFSWYSVGTPKDLSPAKILQTMKAITESAILPYLREQGRKV